jgi:hypothetical protein
VYVSFQVEVASSLMILVTSVTSALSFFSWNEPQAAANVFWKRDQGPTVKCAVCKKRLGHRPALECDDCGSESPPDSWRGIHADE